MIGVLDDLEAGHQASARLARDKRLAVEVARDMPPARRVTAMRASKG
jgi:hypothetical protein